MLRSRHRRASTPSGWRAPSAARVWTRDVLNGYGSGGRPGNLAGRVVSDAELTVSGMDDGSYDVEVWDPWAGNVIGSSRRTRAEAT